MQNRKQYPSFLVRDEKGNVTHVVVQNTDTGEKLVYKVSEIDFEEMGEIIK